MTTDRAASREWAKDGVPNGGEAGDEYMDDGGLSSAKVFERIRIKALSGKLAKLNYVP